MADITDLLTTISPRAVFTPGLLNRGHRAECIIPSQGGGKTTISALFKSPEDAKEQARMWRDAYPNCLTRTGPGVPGRFLNPSEI